MATDEERESLGRIEVAPEALAMIAHYTTLGVEGVQQMAAVPTDVGRLFRRAARYEGVLLDFANGRLAFDLYVLTGPHVNVLTTSRAIQAAVMEAIDKMVGLSVDAINVHVEDVMVGLDEAA